MSDFEKEFGWDDEIEKDSDEWVLLPEGDYDFTVTAFERGRHQGSDKLPPCNKAILTLKVEGKEGTATITHNLFLHSKTEGMLSAFFCAIGQKKHIAEAGCPVDIEEAAVKANDDVVAQREEALAKQLSEMKKRKRKLVDAVKPLCANCAVNCFVTAITAR